MELLMERGLQKVRISRHSSLLPDVFQVITSKEAIDWLEEYPFLTTYDLPNRDIGTEDSLESIPKACPFG